MADIVLRNTLHQNVKKYGRVRQATHENRTWYMLFECWLTNATDTQW